MKCPQKHSEGSEDEGLGLNGEFAAVLLLPCRKHAAKLQAALAPHPTRALPTTLTQAAQRGAGTAAATPAPAASQRHRHRVVRPSHQLVSGCSQSDATRQPPEASAAPSAHLDRPPARLQQGGNAAQAAAITRAGLLKVQAPRLPPTWRPHAPLTVSAGRRRCPLLRLPPAARVGVQSLRRQHSGTAHVRTCRDSHST
jgi:hypothetical protein